MARKTTRRILAKPAADPQTTAPNGQVESLTGGVPGQAIPASQLSGDEATAVDRQAALYEAAGRGDETEFARIRDEGAK